MQNTPEVLPASQYLQERLQERRARNVRPRRVRQSDFGPQKGRDDDIFLAEADDYGRLSRPFDSSPLTSLPRRGSDAGSAGPSRRRTPGVRDLNEQMDRLTKENFALKLELDHRRDHNTKLQEQIRSMDHTLARAEKVEEEHSELLRINSDLIEELEKRDKAIEEAMDIICDLEDRLADADTRSEHTRPSTAKADSGYAGTETQEQAPASSPPEVEIAQKNARASRRLYSASASAATNKLMHVMAAENHMRAKREPLVLAQQLAGTKALRSVYMENAKSLHPVQSFTSLLTRRGQRADEDVELSSPRLSALSESSIRSIYNPRDRSNAAQAAWTSDKTTVNADSSRQDSINRVSRWIDQGEPLEMETPSRPSKSSLPHNPITPRPQPSALQTPIHESQYQSLNDALSNESHDKRSSTARNPQVPWRSRRSIAEAQRPLSFAGHMFGDQSLPATPDRDGAHLLRMSHSTIVGEKSMVEMTPALPPSQVVGSLEPGVRTAPRQMRSSVELKSAYADNLEYRKAHRRMSSSEGDDLDAFMTTGLLGAATSVIERTKVGNSLPFEDCNHQVQKSDFPMERLPQDQNEHKTMPIISKPILRRGSNSESAVGSWNNRADRVDISPPMSALPWRSPTIESKSPDAKATSPRSFTSGTSFGSRAAVQKVLTDLNGPPGGRFFANSPARNLGHRTQRLFRRLSGGQLEQPRIQETRTPRDKGPLPTLTSAPASEYAQPPKEIKRPSTAEMSRQQANPTAPAMQRAPSTSGRRPSFQGRTKTEPFITWGPAQSSGPGSDTTADFIATARTHAKRLSHGATQLNAIIASHINSPVQPAATDATTQGPREALSKRRGSIKDAVFSTALRSWR